jgi:Kef-type K+ transport system membrane component KefB
MLELAGIIILGILAQWVAWKLKLPAILPLILIGLLVGPIAAEYLNDGVKWIEPIWNGEKGLFPGDGLYYFVSLAISIILFEGGLTLKMGEIKISLLSNINDNLAASKILAFRLGENVTPIPIVLNGFKDNLFFLVC